MLSPLLLTGLLWSSPPTGQAPPPRVGVASPQATTSPATATTAQPSEQFNEGKLAFARGQYKRAIELLRPLIRPDVLLESENDLVQTHRMLGVAFLFENDRGGAREEFRQLLELRPESRFDPLLDPPFIVDFFNGVLKEQQAEIRRLELLRERSGKPAVAGTARPILAVRNPYATCFLPFGVGQFQNGDRRKGWAFLGAETLFASASLAAFVTNFALYGVHPRRACLDPATSPDAAPAGCPADRIDHHDEDVSHTLTQVQVGTGILFFATAVWGIVDAVRNYRPYTFEPPDNWEVAPKVDSAAAGPRSAQLELSGSGLSLRF